MGTRIRILLINLIGGMLACGLMLLLLPAPALAAQSKQPEIINHRDLVAPAPEALEEGVDIPDGEHPVTAITLHGSETTHEGTKGVYVLNQTDYSPNYAGMLSDGYTLPDAEEGPQVLILHTHGTEAFCPEGTTSYDPDAIQLTRSENTSENVVAVGNVLAAELERRGIEVIHDETLCDLPSFNRAYTKSLLVAEAILEANPTIRVVIDLHRDSIIASSGVKYRPVTAIAGRQAAQMMLVIGTPQNGKQHNGWLDNLSFAMALQKILSDNYPGLMRPINLRADRFNQHVRPGAILIEVGSCGNSLGEAEYAAELLASGLAQLLT